MRCNEETILTPTAVDMSIDLVDLVCFIGRPFVKRLAVCYRTVILSVCPVCDVGVLWPNSSMDQDKLGVEVGLGPGDIVLDRNPATPKERAQPVQFSACVCCVQRIGWIKMQLGTEVDLSPCHIVLAKVLDDRKFSLEISGPIEWSYFVNFRCTGRYGPLSGPGP